MSESILEGCLRVGLRLTNEDIRKFLASDEFMKSVEHELSYEKYHAIAREICGNILSPE